MPAKNTKTYSGGRMSGEPDNGLRKGKGKDDFPIVAIGASAGGLETLQAFFHNMPDDPEMAIVVIQHLSPQQG